MTTAPLTDQRLADIQARAEAATDGPWWNDEHEIYTVSDLPYEHWIAETCNVDNPQAGRANGEFIAHARQDVPALLAELGRVRAELADTVMMRDFHARSASHIAAKRDLAEAAIASWSNGEMSADAALLIVKKSLADGTAAVPST